MRSLLSLFILVFSVSVRAVSGTWKYSEMIYKGERQPILNPDLNLLWTFFENGTERLYWDYSGIPGFCERFASYKINNGSLEEKVFALNPNNNFECGRDPDMQVGRKTVTPIEVTEKEIFIHVNLGDEVVVYVLTPYVDEIQP